MRWISEIPFRLRAAFRPAVMERELDDEVAFHLERETAKHVARGLAPEEARRRALASFGSVGRHKQRTRDSWGVTLVHDVKSDASFAVRQLRKSPGFAVLAALTLGLGIGGTMALWSVVQGLLLRPLPFGEEERVVTFWSEGDWRGMEYDFVRERARAYEGLAAYTWYSSSFRHGDSTSLLPLTLGSAELFEVLDARPLLGRTFEPADDLPDAEPVIVLSHGLWQEELGGDPEVVGRRLLVGGSPVTVVGVMPAAFYFPFPEQRAWRPLQLDPESSNYVENGYLGILGRVGAGVTEAQLAGDLQALGAALGERFDYPAAWDKSKNPQLTPIRERLVGEVRPAVLLLLGAVALLFLMACANVAALLLTRTADRGEEMAVRTALGAGRGRLARQVLTESLLLGLVASGVGAAFAAGIFDVLVASLPLPFGLAETLALDWTGFAVATVLAVAAASLVSIAPIRTLLQGRLEGDLGRERRRTAGGARRSRVHDGLVVAEVFLAVTLVLGATLLVRTVDRLQSIDPGFEAGVLAVDLIVGADEMETPERWAVFDEALRQVAALPGVSAAALANRLPIRDGGWQGPVTPEERPDVEGPNSFYRTATPDYFRVMGIELLKGRGFAETDRAGALQVAVVSESFARRLWPGEDPLGKRFTTGNENDENQLTVVGVVEEARVSALTGENPLVLYRPHAQRGWPGVGNTLVLRSGLEAVALVAQVRGAVRQVDDRVAVARVTSLDEVVAASIQAPLRIRFYLTLFAVLGLVLGAVGVYGVVSYWVARRRAEVGVRMAMGAAPVQVVGEVLRRGLAPVALGTAGGLAAALLLSRLLRGFLYGIEPTDPASFAVAAAVLLAAGAVAALVPALRAGRVDPVEALRTE